jgi:hypothetical protein
MAPFGPSHKNITDRTIGNAQLIDCKFDCKMIGYDEWICIPAIGTSFAISLSLADPRREALRTLDSKFTPSFAQGGPTCLQ